MDGERIESAVERIERALSRISAISDKGPASSASAEDSDVASSSQSLNVSQLVVKHEELRETVATELKRLDALIERLEG